MTRHLLKTTLLSLALVCSSFHAVRTTAALPLSPVFAAATAEAEPADVDRTFEVESKSTHVGRINRNLMTATVVILVTFVLLRVALLWQIQRSRKKLVHENILQPKA
ncbi:MAG: hypothetical protein RLZZ350_225 [Verrucomicrobiota bacterium]|jgi:lysylphosphatidylglycerol synthetase-like protein (DUF2156 family)